MCILMYFGPGAFPERDHLVNACHNNPDGFGYAVLTWGPEGIITGHSMDADTMIDEFLKVREQFPGQTALFHARIATHGTVNEDNCHPFTVEHRHLKGSGHSEVTGQMILAHNGILPCGPGKGDDRSDTRILAQDILMRRFPHLDSAKTRRRFEDWMGHSKVVILTTDPAYQRQSYIFNQDMGAWLKGADGISDVWYSNTSYLKRSYSYGASYSYQGKTWWEDMEDKGRAVEAWSPASGPSYGGYTLACVACRYSAYECACLGTVETRYLPTLDVRVRVESDNDMSSWKCDGCGRRGGINEDAMCEWCGVMFCCNQDMDACQCWAPNGTLDVGAAVKALSGDADVS